MICHTRVRTRRQVPFSHHQTITYEAMCLQRACITAQYLETGTASNHILRLDWPSHQQQQQQRPATLSRHPRLLLDRKKTQFKHHVSLLTHCSNFQREALVDIFLINWRVLFQHKDSCIFTYLHCCWDQPLKVIQLLITISSKHNIITPFTTLVISNKLVMTDYYS